MEFESELLKRLAQMTSTERESWKQLPVEEVFEDPQGVWLDDWGKEEVKSSSFLEEFKPYLTSLSRNWFRTRVILEFANDWSVSMIRGFDSRGYIEIAVLFRGDLDYNLNPITSGVKRYGPQSGDELKEDLRTLLEFSRDFKPKLSS